jgi:NagD protein
VTGKPDPGMLEGILQRYGLQPDEFAMVGDRLYTDIVMAINTNVLGVLVLTGESQEKDIEQSDVCPDIVVKDISELGRMLINSKA